MLIVSHCLRYLLLGFFLCASVPHLVNAQVSKDYPRPSVIFSNLQNQLSRVNSIRYKASTLAEAPSRTKPQATTIIENRTNTVISGDKYLVKTQIINSELEGSKESIQAYDGLEFQMMDEDRGTLITNTSTSKDQPKNSYRVPQPITVMFSFAYGPMLQNDYTVLKQSDLWNRLAAKSKIIGRESVNSIPCIVVEISGLDGGKSATLYLSEAMGYYPFKVVYQTEILTRTDQIDTFKLISDDRGIVLIPTKVTTNAVIKKSGRNSSLILTVEPASLEVNGRIRESIFTLPKSQASRRVDMAKGEGFKDGEKVTISDHQVPLVKAKGFGVNFLILGVSTGLIAIGIGLTVFRRFRRSKTRS